jgi:hypothetical protein
MLFSVEHWRESRKHRSFWSRGLRRFSLAKICDLASHLARLQFSKRPYENTKRREVAAHERFILTAPTALEPATYGVTGRRANR